MNFSEVVPVSTAWNRGWSFLHLTALLAVLWDLLNVGDQLVEASAREIAISLGVLFGHTAVCAALWVWALRFKKQRHVHWIATALAVLSLVCTSALAIHVDHPDVLPALDARAVLRILTIHFAAVHSLSLLPTKML